jgi:hypothetical protein
MAKANSVHSTPPTNTPIPQCNPADATSRRRFLTKAAGVAAGGAVPAGEELPLPAVAASGVDPIFSLIEDYRAAAKVVAAAAAEVDRREELLIEEGLGQYPVICVRDATCRRGKPEQTMIYTHDQIDRHLRLTATARPMLKPGLLSMPKSSNTRGSWVTARTSCMPPRTRKPRRWTPSSG